MLECLPPTWIRWIEGHSSRMPFFLQNHVSELPEVHTCRIERYHVPPIDPRNPTSRTYLKKIIAQLPWINDRIFTEALFLEMKLGSNLIACQWGLTKLWYIYIMRSLVTEIDIYIHILYICICTSMHTMFLKEAGELLRMKWLVRQVWENSSWIFFKL